MKRPGGKKRAKMRRRRFQNKRNNLRTAALKAHRDHLASLDGTADAAKAAARNYKHQQRLFKNPFVASEAEETNNLTVESEAEASNSNLANFILPDTEPSVRARNEHVRSLDLPTGASRKALREHLQQDAASKAAALEEEAIKWFCQITGKTYYPPTYEEYEDNSEDYSSSDCEEQEQQATSAVPRIRPPTAAELAEAAARPRQIFYGPEPAHYVTASDDEDEVPWYK
ncbi:hypothetical protein OC861_000244 [Tilletia horrida]|nr:hypothetical protein OC861_000244 [Tilletia horrida]